MHGARTPLRIVLVEDSVLLREGSCGSSTRPATSRPARSATPRTSSSGCGTREPDVAILDVRLPPDFRDEGIRAALRLRRELPGVGILVLSQYVEGVYARELLAGGDGGIGYLLKDRVTSLDEFTDAVRRVHEGGTVLDPLVVGSCSRRGRTPSPRSPRASAMCSS